MYETTSLNGVREYGGEAIMTRVMMSPSADSKYEIMFSSAWIPVFYI